MSSEIYIDIDRDRIRSILFEAYDSIGDLLGGVTFNITKEEFLAQIEPFLQSNRVSLPVALPLPSKRYPMLRIEVDLRRCKLFARVHPKSKQAHLNYYLKAL